MREPDGRRTPPAARARGQAPDADPLAPAGNMRAAEIRSMAAFRIREAANRIATLAASAMDDALRSDLLAVHARLLDAERALLEQGRGRPTS